MESGAGIDIGGGYMGYTSADFAAIAWATKYGINGKSDEQPHAELSSLIFQITYERKTYYSFTDPVSWDDDDKAYHSSPGPDSDKHGVLPEGATLFGHIHFHWEGSENLHSSNVGFSRTTGYFNDYYTMSQFPKLSFYVVGATGNLIGRHPEYMGPQTSKRPGDDPEGKEYPILKNVYGPGIPLLDGAFKYTTNKDRQGTYIPANSKPWWDRH